MLLISGLWAPLASVAASLQSCNFSPVNQDVVANPCQKRLCVGPVSLNRTAIPRLRSPMLVPQTQ